MLMGTCSKHGYVKHKKPGKDGRSRCSPCAVAYLTAWRQRVKKTLVEEAGGCCQICGYDRCMAALEFHHRDPAEKSFSVSRTRSIKEARSEINKCILVCS